MLASYMPRPCDDAWPICSFAGIVPRKSAPRNGLPTRQGQARRDRIVHLILPQRSQRSAASKTSSSAFVIFTIPPYTHPRSFTPLHGFHTGLLEVACTRLCLAQFCVHPLPDATDPATPRRAETRRNEVSPKGQFDAITPPFPTFSPGLAHQVRDQHNKRSTFRISRRTLNEKDCRSVVS